MTQLLNVSEEYTHRSQSWIFNGVYRKEGQLFEVEIWKNAYEGQSHAKVSIWGVGGWNHFISLPTEEWYSDLPSYTKQTLEHRDISAFQEGRDRLLVKLSVGLWADGKVQLMRSAGLV